MTLIYLTLRMIQCGSIWLDSSEIIHSIWRLRWILYLEFVNVVINGQRYIVSESAYLCTNVK